MLLGKNLVLLLLIQPSFALSPMPFISGLGWLHVNIVSKDSVINYDMMRHSGSTGKTIRIGYFSSMTTCNKMSDSPLILIATDIGEAKDSIKCASRRRPQLSLVLLFNNITIHLL